LALVPSPTILSTDEMGRVAPPIAAPVGRDGTNNATDVFIIQSLLNDRLPKPHSPVPVTGVADPGFTLAIEAYQAVVMNMIPPSGRVEPGSTTYYSLAARPLVNAPPPPRAVDQQIRHRPDQQEHQHDPQPDRPALQRLQQRPEEPDQTRQQRGADEREEPAREQHAQGGGHGPFHSAVRSAPRTIARPGRQALHCIPDRSGRRGIHWRWFRLQPS